MSIIEHIDADLKEAMKQKNELELSTLRLVRSALKNKQIELGREPTEEEIQSVLRTVVKQYSDALGDFEKAGRTDLATRQKAELGVVQGYLPAAMPADELERLVREAIVSVGAVSPSDTGKVMGAAMKIVAGRADGNAVREVAQRLLAPVPPAPDPS
ncbi:MAG TPA: GatB/YqeY domain-containing protein [Candidatus Methylomirabilis sp.]|nr:GatB/YqeY domain-containing protein [Candidatus Methylomirabilis sp.]